MEAIVAIIGGIIALFFYNKFTKANSLNANDGVKQELDALKAHIERMNKEKSEEERKREEIEKQVKDDSKPVSGDDLAKFFNDRNKPS